MREANRKREREKMCKGREGGECYIENGGIWRSCVILNSKIYFVFVCENDK